TPLRTRAILAQIALCAATCFAAFDDLLAETVGTLDRDERHGLLLAIGHYQDEVQCDSNRSPSPLLEHYPPMWKRPRACILPSRLTMRKPRGAIMALADRRDHVCPLSLTSESSQASGLQGCSAVAWCRGSRGGQRHDRGPKVSKKLLTDT